MNSDHCVYFPVFPISSFYQWFLDEILSQLAIPRLANSSVFHWFKDEIRPRRSISRCWEFVCFPLVLGRNPVLAAHFQIPLNLSLKSTRDLSQILSLSMILSLILGLDLILSPILILIRVSPAPQLCDFVL